MKLQNIILPSPETCTVEDMYLRRDGIIDFTWADPTIKMFPNSALYFDTYFNSFSVNKWKKYTKVKNVYITLRFRGRLRVTLVRKERIGKEVLTHYIKEQYATSDGGEVTFYFDDPYTTGVFCANIFAPEFTEFYGGYYSTDVEASDIAPVKIALDICTFKREHFVKKNMRLIDERVFHTDRYEDFKNCVEAFIIDNAQTLRPEDFGQEFVHLIPNNNLGGAGGFTRGLIEIKKAAEAHGFTHALLMDDDIVVDPECIFRSWAILSLLKDEYKDAFIGGAMLRLDHQHIQVECGAVWNQGELMARKVGMDLRGIEPCLYNEVEETIEYSAWWYTLLPLTVVREDNLPLPIFIRGDDVEYGMRNARRIITMNGICVWHEPFENKYASTMFYYILRNRLIDNAVHNKPIEKAKFIDIMWHQVMEQIYLYRYKNAHLLLDGIGDFLNGVDWFKQQDGQEIHKKVMNNGYKMQYLEDIGAQFDYGAYERSLAEPEKLSFTHKVVKRLTINGIKLKPKRQHVVIPVVTAREINVYRAENVVNYDPLTQKGFVTQRDPAEAQRCLEKMRQITNRINRTYDTVNREYGERAREIMSIGFWKDYLNI